MSKKSRKRNKKILAALALAGGAAMLGRRGVPAAANVDSGRGSGLRDTVDSAKNWITKKAVEPAATLRKPPIGRMRGVGTDAQAIAGQDLRAGLSKRVRGVTHPILGQSTVNPNRFGTLYKKGGRVTGIAKRGVGMPLMKGKK